MVRISHAELSSIAGTAVRRGQVPGKHDKTEVRRFQRVEQSFECLATRHASAFRDVDSREKICLFSLLFEKKKLHATISDDANSHSARAGSETENVPS